jgi:hypothetical protein
MLLGTGYSNRMTSSPLVMTALGLTADTSGKVRGLHYFLVVMHRKPRVLFSVVYEYLNCGDGLLAQIAQSHREVME